MASMKIIFLKRKTWVGAQVIFNTSLNETLIHSLMENKQENVWWVNSNSKYTLEKRLQFKNEFISEWVK